MKPTFKDYLNIVLALLAIFLCGYGIGFLLGERKGQDNQPPPPAPPSQPAPKEQKHITSIHVTFYEPVTSQIAIGG